MLSCCKMSRTLFLRIPETGIWWALVANVKGFHIISIKGIHILNIIACLITLKQKPVFFLFFFCFDVYTYPFSF